MSDLDAVLDLLAGLSRAPQPELSQLFDLAAPVVLARAPGRLDVMGGFADYSGSLTLELPIREAAFVAVQRRREPWVTIVSSALGASESPLRSARFPLAELREHTRSYAAARAYLQRSAGGAWAAYVAGALAALQAELGVELDGGLSMLVASSVPEGKGVSSSAALEVASLRALAGLFGVELEPVPCALICQRVENLVVGAPCGVMDQMTASCGKEGQLLPLLCQPARLEECFPVPAGLELWGIDSGIRHAVSGADYGEVRAAAFMGYRWLAEVRGLAVSPTAQAGQVSISDPEWGGYLARVPRVVFDRDYKELLPERISGADFLSRFGGITDPITRVLPGSSYRVRAATEHPVYEHERASEFRALLQREELGPSAASADSKAVLERLGALMYEAHASYSRCGLGSTGTDRIVELVAELGPERGLYGAKISGGGSGGTVVVLGQAGAADAVQAVARRYASETGHAPHVFSGSSPGAAAFGLRRLQAEAGRWRLLHAMEMKGRS